MIELGQLEANHAEFDKRNVSIVASSVDDLETSKATQADFPHLKILADPERKLAETFRTLHVGAGPAGQNIHAPLSVLVDGAGTVRWAFRPNRIIERVSPKELLAAVDEHVGK